MTEEEKEVAQGGDEQSGEMSDAEIDRNLMESFPASDPPSWTLGTNHHEEAEEDKSTDSEEAVGE
ncbi:MAG TPA: hypothetical protein VJT09_18115 [Pyrinomonadaceae bacterium]|nr:hypothetical protein [Pyrinomonadaceae bacterium]